MKRWLALGALMIWATAVGWAQCAMCKAAAESNVNDPSTQVAAGINDGVIYLLVMPYLLVAGAGVVWYVRFREKKKA